MHCKFEKKPIYHLIFGAKLRQKQRGTDQLCGKLAAGSKLSEPELSQKLQEALARVMASEHI